MQEVAWLLLNGCDFEGAKSSPLEERCPFLEMDLPGSDPILTNRDPTRTAPRCLKTHLKEVRAIFSHFMFAIQNQYIIERGFLIWQFIMI